MRSPKYSMGQLVAVCSGWGPLIVIPRTHITGMVYMEAGYYCGDTGREIPEGWYHRILEYPEGSIEDLVFGESELRPIDDDEYTEGEEHVDEARNKTTKQYT